jgi:predicted ferric reductase
MRERGDILVGLMVAFMVLFPLGYLIHVSPRFPGSLAGGITGIAAAALMMLTLPYVLVKHVKWVANSSARFVSKPTLLAVHIYAGVLAAILGLIHAAHTFESPAGLILTGSLLLTVLSGYIGRYLLGQVAKALRGRKSELASLQAAFLGLEASFPEEPESPPLRRWRKFFFVSGERPVGPVGKDAESLAAAMADTEFAVRAESATDALFGRWRWLHIVLGCIVYAVLVVHIGAAVYFGLRWL